MTTVNQIIQLVLGSKPLPDSPLKTLIEEEGHRIGETAVTVLSDANYADLFLALHDECEALDNYRQQLGTALALAKKNKSFEEIKKILGIVNKGESAGAAPVAMPMPSPQAPLPSPAPGEGSLAVVAAPQARREESVAAAAAAPIPTPAIAVAVTAAAPEPRPVAVAVQPPAAVTPIPASPLRPAASAVLARAGAGAHAHVETKAPRHEIKYPVGRTPLHEEKLRDHYDPWTQEVLASSGFTPQHYVAFEESSYTTFIIHEKDEKQLQDILKTTYGATGEADTTEAAVITKSWLPPIISYALGANPRVECQYDSANFVGTGDGELILPPTSYNLAARRYLNVLKFLRRLDIGDESALPENLDEINLRRLLDDTEAFEGFDDLRSISAEEWHALEKFRECAQVAPSSNNSTHRLVFVMKELYTQTHAIAQKHERTNPGFAAKVRQLTTPQHRAISIRTKRLAQVNATISSETFKTHTFALGSCEGGELFQTSAKQISSEIPTNLIFVVDVSGSMHFDAKGNENVEPGTPTRQALLNNAIMHTVESRRNMNAQHVSLATFHDTGSIDPEVQCLPISGQSNQTNVDKVRAQLPTKTPGGTDLVAGLEAGYQCARAGFDNIMVFCTDGQTQTQRTALKAKEEEYKLDASGQRIPIKISLSTGAQLDYYEAKDDKHIIDTKGHLCIKPTTISKYRAHWVLDYPQYCALIDEITAKEEKRIGKKIARAVIFIGDLTPESRVCVDQLKTSESTVAGLTSEDQIKDAMAKFMPEAAPCLTVTAEIKGTSEGMPYQYNLGTMPINALVMTHYTVPREMVLTNREMVVTTRVTQKNEGVDETQTMEQKVALSPETPAARADHRALARDWLEHWLMTRHPNANLTNSQFFQKNSYILSNAVKEAQSTGKSAQFIHYIQHHWQTLAEGKPEKRAAAAQLESIFTKRYVRRKGTPADSSKECDYLVFPANRGLKRENLLKEVQRVQERRGSAFVLFGTEFFCYEKTDRILLPLNLSVAQLGQLKTSLGQNNVYKLDDKQLDFLKEMLIGKEAPAIDAFDYLREKAGALTLQPQAAAAGAGAGAAPGFNLAIG